MLKLFIIKQLQLAVYDTADNKHNKAMPECDLDVQCFSHAQRALTS